ncbi:MAG TPA: alpha/beta hydrolase [Thermoflexales bacterium]|nr:alpha/beta hydrolase [Thermoflexales bacterium]
MESHFCPVPNGQLYYETAGDESRPAALFIHGFSLDTRLWDTQWLVFAREFRVIRCDLRGYGRSSLPVDGYSPVEDVRAILEHTGVGRAALVGLSRGGGLAVDFAITHPGMTRALVLVDAALGGWSWSARQKELDEAVWQIARERGLDAAKQAWLMHPLFAQAMRNPQAAAQLTRMVQGWSGWQFLHRDPAIYPKPPAAKRLAEVHAPALVVAGEHDLDDFLGIAAFLADGIRGAQKIILPNAGHLPPLETQDAFNAAVLAFLKDESRSG